MKTIAIIIITLVCAQVAAAQEPLEWVNGVVWFGMFPREKCKQISSMTYVDSCFVLKPNRPGYWNERSTVEFDTLGRPIRVITTRTEPDQTRYDEYLVAYSAAGCILLSHSRQLGVTPTRIAETQTYCHDGLLDSVAVDPNQRQAPVSMMDYDAAGRVVRVIKRNRGFPVESRPWVRHDTTTYSYDAEGRMTAMQTPRHAVDYAYLGADSVVIDPHIDDDRRLEVVFNAQGLPQSIAVVVTYRKRRVLSRADFQYTYR